MSLRLRTMLLCCLALAGCKSADEAETEAAAIADDVAPGTMIVTGSRSNMMRDQGRTVALDYDSDGYAFPVLLDLGPLGCKTETGGCEAALRRQVDLGRAGRDAERVVAPAIAACELAFREDRRRVAVRATSIEPPIRNVAIDLESVTPIADEGQEGLRAVETCATAILAAHEAGPFGDLETSFNLVLPPETPFPAPDGLDALQDDEEAPYFTVTRFADRPIVWQVHLPFYWGQALQPVWSERAQAALDTAGIAMDVLPGVAAGTIRPVADDRGRWVVHLYASDRTPVPTGSREGDARGLPGHVVRLIHDARTGGTEAVCVVRDIRDDAGRIVPDRIEGACAEPIRDG